MFLDKKSRFALLGFWILLLIGSAVISEGFFACVYAQEPPMMPPPPPISPEERALEKPAPIKKLGAGLVSIGNILVDTAKKEVTVPGRMLRDQTLEFLGTTKRGMKSYESAMELDTNAVSFNLALIMIGLQKSNAVAPQQHFDAAPTVGDPVDIWVEWGTGDSARKLRADELLYDLRTKSVPKLGVWVYTGSTVLPDGPYLAELNGVLIGFVHDPASIIENSTGGGLNAYGSIRLNPDINIAPDTPIKLTVKALPKQK